MDYLSSSPWRRLLIGLAGLLLLIPAQAESLKPNDQVLLFNTAAQFDTLDNTWRLPVHGWVHERGDDRSLWRNITTKGLGKLFGLDDDVNLEGNANFRQRARMFLVDNAVRKNLRINLLGRYEEVGDSTANGHFNSLLTVPTELIPAQQEPRWVPITIVPADNAPTEFAGQIQLLPPTGLSIISDIDDTIKISNVLDKHELMQNTFVREFTPVPGMSILYQHWQQQGAAFHYVSASPWQLYSALSEFLTVNKFPTGSLQMKLFRFKDESYHNLFISPYDYKLPILTELLQHYPQRQFILVGDSGEKDPEVYATMLERFPGQVKHIYIRDVTQEVQHGERYQKLYAHLDMARFTVFNDAVELLNTVNN